MSVVGIVVCKKYTESETERIGWLKDLDGADPKVAHHHHHPYSSLSWSPQT